MPTTILVPLDGSDLAARSLPFVAWLARSRGARLLLLRVPMDVNERNVPHAQLLTKIRGQELLDRLEAMAELTDVAEQLRQNGIAVETDVRSGDVAQTIIETTRSRQARLIVMSTHGRGGLGRWLYGSVADQVLRLTPSPVLLVPPACERSWPNDRPLRVLLTLDGSPLAEAVLGPAANLAGPHGVDVILLQVIEGARPGTRTHASQVDEAQAYLEATAKRLGAGVHGVTVRTVIGHAAQAITATARTQDVDLIAMATHGRGGLARLVLGSIAEETLKQASVPLLLVRPSTLRTETDATGAGRSRDRPQRAPVD